MIDRELKEIQEGCEYLLTKQQLAIIRKAMANYALAAVMDSAVRKEAESICQEGEKDG